MNRDSVTKVLSSDTCPTPLLGEPRLAVIGLGKLGCPMLAVFASRGFEVIGADLVAPVVEAVNQGRPPVRETGLGDLMTEGRARYRATTDVAAAAAAADVVFLIVPTPSDADGGFSLRHVLSACAGVGRAMRDGAAYRLVVLTATVMPGSTGGPVRDALERASGKRCGRDFGLCYSPEFIALGSVVNDLLRPDFVLIGESDPRAGAMLEALYGRVCTNSPPIARMNWINAELAKLSLNTYVTMKISFANMIAGLCQRLPDADVDTVTQAIALDSRVGRRYLKGAIGYGGPCFPRDNLALAALARRVDADASLAETTDRFNRSLLHRLAVEVESHLPPGGTVGVLGVSYKPHTEVIEESQAVELARLCAERGARVVVFDPAAGEAARAALGAAVDVADSAEACIAAADVVVLATPWPEFARLEAAVFARPHRRRVVIDCWRALERAPLADVADYLAVGSGPDGSGPD